MKPYPLELLNHFTRPVTLKIPPLRHRCRQFRAPMQGNSVEEMPAQNLPNAGECTKRVKAVNSEGGILYDTPARVHHPPAASPVFMRLPARVLCKRGSPGNAFACREIASVYAGSRALAKILARANVF